MREPTDRIAPATRARPTVEEIARLSERANDVMGATGLERAMALSNLKEAAIALLQELQARDEWTRPAVIPPPPARPRLVIHDVEEVTT